MAYIDWERNLWERQAGPLRSRLLRSRDLPLGSSTRGRQIVARRTPADNQRVLRVTAFIVRCGVPLLRALVIARGLERVSRGWHQGAGR